MGENLEERERETPFMCLAVQKGTRCRDWKWEMGLGVASHPPVSPVMVGQQPTALLQHFLDFKLLSPHSPLAPPAPRQVHIFVRLPSCVIHSRIAGTFRITRTSLAS